VVDERNHLFHVRDRLHNFAEAEQNVEELKASLDQAKAATERANSEVKLAQENYDRQSELFSKKVIAQVTLDTYTRNLETAKQSTPPPRLQKSARGSPFRRKSAASIRRSLNCRLS